jgi:hypothetical protein
MTHDINSPNDMVMDTDDYIGVASEPEKVAIIDPDSLEQSEADQLQDLPLATDRAYSFHYSFGCLHLSHTFHDMHPVGHFCTRDTQANHAML